MLPSYPPEGLARHEEGFINSADHLRLFWQRYTPTALPNDSGSGVRATVVVLHGGGDHCGRYPALTDALVRAGLQVALVDLRGHGQSDGRRWHVDTFQDNVADLDAFVAKLSQDGVANDRLFVLGHSHGALVAAIWGLTRGRHVSGFVFSSPFFKLATAPPLLKLLAARTVGRLVPWLPVEAGFDVSDLTTDEELQRWTDRDPLYGRKTTPGWFAAATGAQRELLRRAPEFRARFLVLAAGDDRIADPAAARAFVDGAGSSDKRMKVYAGFRHEIFNEVRRQEPIGEAVAWLVDHAP
jgi:alpha-beta hydrolase superfamily lysophospholipase